MFMVVLKILLLTGITFYIWKEVLPKISRTRINEKKDFSLKKAKQLLLFLSFLILLYIILDFYEVKKIYLHLLLSLIIPVSVKNVVHHYVLQRFGIDSDIPLKVEDEFMINKLNDYIDEEKIISEAFTYNDNNYLKRETGFYKVIIGKKHTSISNFWEFFISFLIWVLTFVSVIFAFSIDTKIPDIVISVVAFFAAYVLSPLYTDFYNTYIIAKDDEVKFGNFVKIIHSGNSYFGEVVKLSLFKVSIDDNYKDNKITFFHKLFINSVVETYPNGRFIEYEYVISSEDRKKLKENIPNWIREYCKEGIFDIPMLTYFPHNFGYGLKLRIKVKSKFLKSYGKIKDDLIHLISEKSEEDKIDLRTFNETNVHLKNYNEEK